MSRSYRRPYSCITGAHSAKKDKILAHRGQRRVFDNYLKLRWEDEDFLMPHFRACPHNNVWGWSRDGRQRYQHYPRPHDPTQWSFWSKEELDKHDRWSVEWYLGLTRK
jgi:hypothetical protein